MSNIFEIPLDFSKNLDTLISKIVIDEAQDESVFAECLGTTDFFVKYKIGRLLGKGAFGSVITQN